MITFDIQFAHEGKVYKAKAHKIVYNESPDQQEKSRIDVLVDSIVPSDFDFNSITYSVNKEKRELEFGRLALDYYPLYYTIAAVVVEAFDSVGLLLFDEKPI